MRYEPYRMTENAELVLIAYRRLIAAVDWITYLSEMLHGITIEDKVINICIADHHNMHRHNENRDLLQIEQCFKATSFIFPISSLAQILTGSLFNWIVPNVVRIYI